MSQSREAWQLDNMKKDAQSITAAWQPSKAELIEGVQVKEVKNVMKNNGILTEIYRKDWLLDTLPVEQIFQVLLEAGAISAWHAHEKATDRLFVASGMIQIVLFDARKNSSTYGKLNVFRFGASRPALVTVPPQVWHGVQNISSQPALLLNAVDQAYQYEDPDHWRIPQDDPQIPFEFKNTLDALSS